MKNEGTKNMYIHLSKQEEKLPDDIRKVNEIATNPPTISLHLRKPTENIIKNENQIEYNENVQSQSIYSKIQNRNRGNVKYLMLLFTTLYITPV